MARKQGKLDWHGAERLAELLRLGAERVERAAVHVKGRVQENLGTYYPPASAKGEFPHVRTGQLRRSIIAEKADGIGLTWRIGSDQKYGLYLEYGGRSFLRRTLVEEQAAVKRILAKGA